MKINHSFQINFLLKMILPHFLENYFAEVKIKKLKTITNHFWERIDLKWVIYFHLCWYYQFIKLSMTVDSTVLCKVAMKEKLWNNCYHPPLKEVDIIYTCIYHRQLLIRDTFYASLMWSLFTVLTVYSERKQSEQNI
jgi:hypothetical protein